MSSSKLAASAILATYNSGSTLIASLDTLLSQTIPIEIIVVDDGSRDNSKSLMDRTIRLHPKNKIKLLSQNHQGPAIARNLGATFATTDILLFVDSDMTFDKDYVKELIAPIKKGGVIGTYTSSEMVSNWDNSLARCWNYQEGWAPKYRFPPHPPKYGTDFRAIKKSEFDRVGGFDNIGYTDTWSLFNKLGVRPMRTSAICYHKNPSTYQSVFRQAKWAAKRPYKLGVVGTLYSLVRTSLPISTFTAIFGCLSYRELAYLPFKLTYDLGRFVGIIEMILTGNLIK